MKQCRLKIMYEKIGKRGGRFIGLFLLGLVVTACGGGEGEKKGIKFDGLFPYVEVPVFIKDTNEVVRYLVENYWARYFKIGMEDTSAFSMDQAKFAEAYAGYVQVLNIMQNGKDRNQTELDLKRIAASQKTLFATADSLYMAGHKTVLARLLDMSEKFLYNPNSSYLNEELYIQALEAILQLKSLDSLHKIPYVYQLTLAKLNRVGSKANDFEYVYKIAVQNWYLTRNNNNLKRSTLYKLPAEYLLIYFNNPDCASCKEIQQALATNTRIQKMLESGKLKVLSMYIDEDTALWESRYDDFPKEWIYARDEKGILRDNEIYGIRAIPSMYLLDKNKTVLLKDASVGKVIGYFEQL